MTLKQVVEALVFASPKPLTPKEILAALKAAGDPAKTEDQMALDYAKAKEADILAALAEIAEELRSSGRAFRLQEQINGWSFVTDPGAVQWVRKLYPEAKPTRLSGPQLETLAIIAYRQPVTRADIEAVRGVAVDGVVQILLERSLIKIAGRAEVPGRPLLYETTEYFLQHFGIKSVDELPNAAELKRVELPKAPVPEAPQAPAEAESIQASDSPGAARGSRREPIERFPEGRRERELAHRTRITHVSLRPPQ
jgi:segregation and condensation protein B